MLRITIQETEDRISIRLEGRIAGAWLAELRKVWMETDQRLGSRELALDVSDVTYADAKGKDLLREIYTQTHAEIVTGTLWARYLAEEITSNQTDSF